MLPAWPIWTMRRRSSPGKWRPAVQERADVVAAFCLGVQQRQTLQARGRAPGPVLVVPEEPPPVRLERGDRKVGRHVVDPGVPHHERVLRQDNAAARVAPGPALHGLRHPVRVRQLLQGVEVRVLDDGDDIRLQGTCGGVRDADVDHQPLFLQGDEERRGGSDSMDLRDNAGVAQAHMAFVEVARLEGRDIEGGDDHVLPVAREPQVQGGSLEIRGGLEGDVAGDAVRSGSPLQMSAPPV